MGIRVASSHPDCLLPKPEIRHFSFPVFQISILVQLFRTRVDYWLFIKFEKLVKTTSSFKNYGSQIYIGM